MEKVEDNIVSYEAEAQVRYFSFLCLTLADCSLLLPTDYMKSQDHSLALPSWKFSNWVRSALGFTQPHEVSWVAI